MDNELRLFLDKWSMDTVHVHGIEHCKDDHIHVVWWNKVGCISDRLLGMGLNGKHADMCEHHMEAVYHMVNRIRLLLNGKGPTMKNIPSIKN